MPSAAATLTQWAEPTPELGPAVYRVTNGPREHKHTYHIFCPWSPDGRLLLLVRFDRVNPEGELCVLEAETGEVRVVDRIGSPLVWNGHSVAGQQWLGDTGRILFLSDGEEGPLAVTIRPDGSDRRVVSEEGEIDGGIVASSDGRWFYTATPLTQLFPNDGIAPRHDKGLWRIDVQTGERQLVMSVEHALELLPDPDAAAPCHMYIKMFIHHRRLPRVFFNFVNAMWDRDGKEPRIRAIITMDADGTNGAHLGRVQHHPNWHPIEDRVLANVKDFNDETRFGLYRGDGGGLLEYVPNTRGSGHPSFSPDGRWIFTDGNGDGGIQLIFCDPKDGCRIVAADFDQAGDGYAAYKALNARAEGSTVIDALARAVNMRDRNWQTQAHPTWSRDGSAVLFNADLGNGSQLYMIRVSRALSGA